MAKYGEVWWYDHERKSTCKVVFYSIFTFDNSES